EGGGGGIGPGTQARKDEAAILLRENGDALEARVVERRQHGPRERLAGARDVSAQDGRTLGAAAQVVQAPRGAGEDGGEAVVADLHEHLGEARRGCEPRGGEAVGRRAQPVSGTPVAPNAARPPPVPARAQNQSPV